MWKKLLIMMIALCGTYACMIHFDELKADSNPYHVNGTITGRIHTAPEGITNASFGLQKGDKVYMGIANTAHNTPFLEWQLLREDTYTDYGCIVYDPNKKPVDQICKKPEISSWYSLMTEDIGITHAGFNESDFYEPENLKASQWHHIKKAPYVQSTSIIPMLDDLQKKIEVSTNDYNILSYRNLGFSHTLYDNPMGANKEDEANIKDSVLLASLAISKSYNDLNRNVFLLPYEEMYWGVRTDIPKLDPKDRVFPSKYYISYFTDDPGFGEVGRYFAATVGVDGTIEVKNFGAYSATNPNYKASVRPASYLNFDDVVFGVSQGDASSTQTINHTILPQTYSSIINETKPYKGMKLRIKNTSLDDTLIFHEIRNGGSQEVTQVTRGAKVEVHATGKQGSTGDGVNTISAIIFDEQNNFVYYQPLGVARPMGFYPLDTSHMKIGKYKIGIVNEAYNENSYSPADCSSISELKPLEILPELHVTLTNTPQGQDTYEYSKNVNDGDQVAELSTAATIDGIEYPTTGTSPITYTIKPSTDSEHADDANHFEVKQNAYGNTYIAVKTKGGLDAGTYEFFLHAQDRNREPIQEDGSTGILVPVTIVVEPTELSLAFVHPETTKKSINEARLSWSETAITNVASSEVQISYSISGGDIGLINYYAFGSVSYKGDHEFGIVKIKATADDHPMFQKDNYKHTSVEKEIVIYRNVDGYVTPDEASSSVIWPTFTATDSNSKVGGTIGVIHGTKGTPDTIDGSTISYRYGIKNDALDANYFAVNALSGQITSTANLAKGTYQITVTISDQWSTKELDVMIHIDMANCEELHFYESASSNTIITEKEVKFTDRNVSVFATVKDSTNNNPVEYSIRGGGTDVIEIHPLTGAIEIQGTGTVTIIATKKGESGQADARADLTFTVLASEQAFQYVDASGNELPKTGIMYDPLIQAYQKDQTFQLYTSGVSKDSEVTYRLKENAPSDVIRVEETGLVHILNASLANQLGSVIVVATSHDPTGSFEDQSIELPIQITKAKQELSFAEVIYVEHGKGSVQPLIHHQNIGSHDGGALVLDQEYYISIPIQPADAFVSTKDGKRIDYEYDGAKTIEINLHVEKAGNRNYEKAEADGVMKLLGPDESILAIQGPSVVTYGDHFEISSLQHDEGSKGVTYTFEVDSNTYVSEPSVQGHKAEFDAIHASGDKNTIITVTRRAEGEVTLSKSLSVKVLPKDIVIQIDDQEKQQGDQNPPFTLQDYISQLVSWNGEKDVVDLEKFHLQTKATQTSSAGKYPIYADETNLQNNYPNYHFVIHQGTLTILKEPSQLGYDIVLMDGKDTPYTHGWTKYNVKIIPKQADSELSSDQLSWTSDGLTINQEGITTTTVWLRLKHELESSKHQEIIKIDQTAPRLMQITATSNDQIESVINSETPVTISPSASLHIKTTDENHSLETSGTNVLYTTLYDYNNQLIEEQTLHVEKESAALALKQKQGKYRLCMIAEDLAGNTGTEECFSLVIQDESNNSQDNNNNDNNSDNGNDNSNKDDYDNNDNNGNDSNNTNHEYNQGTNNQDGNKKDPTSSNNQSGSFKQPQDHLDQQGSVKGTYTNEGNHAGGLNTGESRIGLVLLWFVIASLILCLSYRCLRHLKEN